MSTYSNFEFKTTSWLTSALFVPQAGALLEATTVGFKSFQFSAVQISHKITWIRSRRQPPGRQTRQRGVRHCDKVFQG
ncbi:hypothetical protein M427DRAFT_325167 [Gonapodya prolifera JEL478]|uniref:Uncharacterized protein n=1 Tax=Gonapodya prolifera (strain JEL478) TaxID=1344416 RepID=A0A139AF44_GONPJ|nr:hypothetical protein M427DRAFT_325167 [Gonapodya prolifera JEL478]|eukprot:KXS15436.1 hypothetical protein M427DRAFT_325167 [Gonapodya prolifera JEL478]